MRKQKAEPRLTARQIVQNHQLQRRLVETRLPVEYRYLVNGLETIEQWVVAYEAESFAMVQRVASALREAEQRGARKRRARQKLRRRSV